MNTFLKHDFNITALKLCCYVPPSGGKHEHFNRPSHGLALHCSGERVYIFQSGERLTVRGGEMIFLPQGSTYYVETVKPGDCYAINFSEPAEFPPFIFCGANNAYLKAFQKAERTWKERRPGYRAACKSELYRIIALMQQERVYLPKQKMALIHPAVEYIQKHYESELISIPMLASLCGITPEYLRRLFGAAYGCSPVRYINGLKISRAKELLDSGMYSLSEAASLSGYTDMSHFSREFKKSEGISPSKYKKGS